MEDFERDFYDEEETEGEGYAEVDASKKKKRRKSNATKKGKGWAVAFLVAMLCAFVGFIVLTVIQDRILNTKATVPVVVAIAEVPEGIKLTEGNMALYFAIQERDAEQTPTGIIYSTATPILGKITGRNIHINEIITADCFKEENQFDEIEDAVELSLELGSLGQTVSGTLRAGDLVDIIAVIKVEKEQQDPNALVETTPGLMDIDMEGQPPLFTIDPNEIMEGTTTEEVEVEVEDDTVIIFDENGEVLEGTKEELDLSYGITGEYVAQLVAENIRVTNVFTSGGEQNGATAETSNMIATVVNISVPRAYVDAILIAQEEGKITLVKVDEEAELMMNEEATTSATSTTTTTTTTTGTTAQ